MSLTPVIFARKIPYCFLVVSDFAASFFLSYFFPLSMVQKVDIHFK